jgi:hypothetical protein
MLAIFALPRNPVDLRNEIRAIDKSTSIRKPFTSSPAAEYRLHEEIAADYSDMIMRRRGTATRPSSASGGSSTAPSPTAWRKPATVCSPSPACRRANGAARGRRMQLSACTRSSHEGSKHKPVLPCADTAAMLFWRCLPWDRSTCAKSMVGRRSPPSRQISHLTSNETKRYLHVTGNRATPNSNHIAGRHQVDHLNGEIWFDFWKD